MTACDLTPYYILLLCTVGEVQQRISGQIVRLWGGMIGNAHLKWAFSEGTCLFMRESDRAKAYVAKLEKKHGKGKALSILAPKLGRAVYFVMKRKGAFDEKYFFNT